MVYVYAPLVTDHEDPPPTTDTATDVPNESVVLYVVVPVVEDTVVPILVVTLKSTTALTVANDAPPKIAISFRILT
jgi:hypothetical protein